MPPKPGEEPGSSSQDADVSSLHSLLDEEIDRVSLGPNKVKHYRHLKYIRIIVLFLLWLTFTMVLLVTKEHSLEYMSTAVPTRAEGKVYEIESQPESNSLTLYLVGPFMYKLTDGSGNEMVYFESPLKEKNEKTDNFLIVTVNRRYTTDDGKRAVETVSKPWRLMLVDSEEFDEVYMFVRRNIFTFNPRSKNDEYFYKLTLENVEDPVPLWIKSFPAKLNTDTSMALSCLLIIGMFLLLFWDVTSRAIIGLLFSTTAVALLGLYYLRPNIQGIAQLVEIDYVLLLFGLTIIVGVFAETRADLYLAVQVFRLSNGHVWPTMNVLCVATVLGSAVLDEITVLMLLTLFALRLCEVQQLNPANVLTCLILFSNIGHMLTAKAAIESSILSRDIIHITPYKFMDYFPFMLQMMIPVSIAVLLTYSFLRLYYRSSASMSIVEPPIVARLRHAIRFWSRTAQTVGDYSEVEKAVQVSVRNKIGRLRDRLRRIGKMPLPSEEFQVKLKRLEEKHTFENKPRIIMCGVVLFLILIFQFGYIFNVHDLTHGWTCLLFSLILLAACSWKDFESLMTKMDWSTFLLVACIMIITQALGPLGFLDELGDIVVNKIRQIDREHRLLLGAIILLCVSAIGSAVFDTDYICYVMADSVIDLVHTQGSDLAMEPLILAVVLGAGFGCNVTLISAISNIVCAGLAEKHGYKFYFWDFFKVGIIVTSFCLLLSVVYIFFFNLALGYK